MKHFLPTLFCLFLFASVSAQVDISVSPNPYEGTFAVDLSDEWVFKDAHGTLTNNSSSTLDIKWTVEVVDAPAEWQISVCDQNQCYLPTVSTNISANLNEPVVLAPGDTSLQDVRVTPKGVAGNGQVKVHFSLVDDPDNIIYTAEYDITISGVVSTFEEVKRVVKVFPNPTTDYIELTNSEHIDRLVIYNLIGRRVNSFDVIKGKQYNVANLPAGIYLVSLINDEKGVLRTFRLSKRNIRPQ